MLQNLRPEPEEELSRFIGDAAAQRIVGLLRMSASHWRQLAERMLDYERALPGDRESDARRRATRSSEFNAAVARLRDDVARLEKRVELRERA